MDASYEKRTGMLIYERNFEKCTLLGQHAIKTTFKEYFKDSRFNEPMETYAEEYMVILNGYSLTIAVKIPKEIHDFGDFKGQVGAVGHFDDDPPAEGVAQQDHLFQPQGGDELHGPVGVIVHRPLARGFRRLAEARKIRRGDLVFCRHQRGRVTEQLNVRAPAVEHDHRFLRIGAFTKIITGDIVNVDRQEQAFLS